MSAMETAMVYLTCAIKHKTSKALCMTVWRIRRDRLHGRTDLLRKISA